MNSPRQGYSGASVPLPQERVEQVTSQVVPQVSQVSQPLPPQVSQPLPPQVSQPLPPQVSQPLPPQVSQPLPPQLQRQVPSPMQPQIVQMPLEIPLLSSRPRHSLRAVPVMPDEAIGDSTTPIRFPRPGRYSPINSYRKKYRKKVSRFDMPPTVMKKQKRWSVCRTHKKLLQSYVEGCVTSPSSKTAPPFSLTAIARVMATSVTPPTGL